MTELSREMHQLISKYPRFEDGRINYKTERICPVVNCVIRYGDEVLLTERGADVIAYPNTISGVSGFIDEIKPLEDVVRQELQEEVGLEADAIGTLKVFPEIIQIDEAINREWHVFPAFAIINEKIEPKINWENKRAIWMTIDEARARELMPGFREVFEIAMEQSNKDV